MGEDFNRLSQKLMRKGFASLTQGEKKVLNAISDRLHISRNVVKDYEQHYSLGQRVADKVASFGGSWTFIILFAGLLVAWVGLNSFILSRAQDVFDPYPYILLNLMLSMIAAFQAPIIMMSQNRQAAKDREDAENDYHVNLKAELEIMALHEKIDAMRQEQLEQFLKVQQDQLGVIKEMIASLGREMKSK
jgi:uncharacterized membrane protein